MIQADIDQNVSLLLQQAIPAIVLMVLHKISISHVVQVLISQCLGLLHLSREVMI